VEQGVREIVLTGTNIGDYGTDWEGSPQLGALIRMILEYTDLERLRVSSLDPTEITPEIFELMAHHPRLCPHFHVSLQSPHSRILRLMKRRYGYNEVKRCLESIAQIAAGQPGGVFVGMDVITGFPGETESEFEWTVEALTSLPWSRLHVFPYSERAGTPATRLPASVPQADRVARTQILNRLSLDRLKAHYTAVLEVFKKEQAPLLNGVLLEKLDSRGWQAGFTANYLRVMIPGSKSTAQSGDVVAIGASRRNQLASVMPRELMVDSRGYDVALVCDLV
jgi:threonylcarbamoyladenosine tRNA methylthiotransferase MtaB